PRASEGRLGAAEEPGPHGFPGALAGPIGDHDGRPRRGLPRRLGIRRLGQNEGRSLLAGVADAAEEGGCAPEVGLLPRAERVVVALGAAELDAEEETADRARHEAGVGPEILTVGHEEGALRYLRDVPFH